MGSNPIISTTEFQRGALKFLDTTLTGWSASPVSFPAKLKLLDTTLAGWSRNTNEDKFGLDEASPRKRAHSSAG